VTRKKHLQNDELPRGALRAVLLSLLAERPAHGYALVRSVEERTGGALKMREGTLYPALHELEIEGLVEADVEIVGGRKRRVYALTRRGRHDAREWRDHWTAMTSMLQALLATPRSNST
jgi:PadR family transcriptional regulator, regulatory protein PadR